MTRSGYLSQFNVRTIFLFYIAYTFHDSFTYEILTFYFEPQHRVHFTHRRSSPPLTQTHVVASPTQPHIVANHCFFFLGEGFEGIYISWKPSNEGRVMLNIGGRVSENDDVYRCECFIRGSIKSGSMVL